MTVHTLTALMDLLSRHGTLTEEEQGAASVLAAGVERALPKGRVYVVLQEDHDPMLSAIDAIARDVAELTDSAALIEDHLTEIKRMRVRLSGSREGGSDV